MTPAHIVVILVHLWNWIPLILLLDFKCDEGKPQAGQDRFKFALENYLTSQWLRIKYSPSIGISKMGEENGELPEKYGPKILRTQDMLTL